jgi:hypothetical protein
VKQIIPGSIAIVDGFTIIVTKIQTDVGEKYSAMISFIIDQDDEYDEDSEILDLPIITNIVADTIFDAVRSAYMVGTAFSIYNNDDCFLIDENGETIDVLSIDFILGSTETQPIVH